MNADKLLQWLLDIEMPVTVQELLGAMLELYKRVFQPMNPPWIAAGPGKGLEVNAMVYKTNEIKRG